MKILISGIAIVVSFFSYQTWKGLDNLSPGLVQYSGEWIASTNQADTTRLDGTWYLQPVLASDTATGHIPFITFDVKKKRFSGHTGCNRMSGRFELTGKTLGLDSNIVTTKMACTGYNESAFIKSLLHTNGYKFDNGQLVLLFDATELSRWDRVARPAPRMRKA